jgi:hypothetical protein
MCGKPTGGLPDDEPMTSGTGDMKAVEKSAPRCVFP